MVMEDKFVPLLHIVQSHRTVIQITLGVYKVIFQDCNLIPRHHLTYRTIDKLCMGAYPLTNNHPYKFFVYAVHITTSLV